MSVLDRIREKGLMSVQGDKEETVLTGCLDGINDPIAVEEAGGGSMEVGTVIPAKESSVVIFERAALLLAEADTIQKAHELKNLCLTAAEWARRKGMGEDAIKHAKSYALEAGRKMGEMLAETQRAPGKLVNSLGVPGGNSEENTPTLSSLSVSRKESSEAQKLARMPRELFEMVKAGELSKERAIGIASVPGLAKQVIEAVVSISDAVKIVEDRKTVVKSCTRCPYCKVKRCPNRMQEVAR